MSDSRVNLGQIAPDLYQAVDKLENAVSEYAETAGIAKSFTHLLKLRASQINECAYCVRLHTNDALTSGESSERIALIAAWRESEYFTEKERATLALIEAVTLISEGQIPDSVYAEATVEMTNEEIAAVEWIGVTINAWNRIAIASRIPVIPE